MSADAARISITVPQLYRQEKDGDLKATAVQYKISVLPSGGSFRENTVVCST